MTTPTAVPLTPQLRAEIEARHHAATEGPYEWTSEQTLEGRAGDEYYRYSTEVIEIDHDHGCACRQLCELTVTISDADRAALAHSWADIEVLLSEIDRLRAVLEHRHQSPSPAAS